MKKWLDIPEYQELYKELCKECEKINDLEEKSQLEFDPEITKLKKAMLKKLDDFIDQYMKDHPEEFDENGQFKV